MLNDVPLPLTTQTLGVTQNPTRQNFLNIDAGFSVNHVPFNTANVGMHASVQMPQQTGDPGTVANSVALVAKVGTLGVAPFATQMFFQPANNVASFEVSSGQVGIGGNGWCMLGGGFIMQWGTINIANTTTLTFAANPPNFTFPTACYSVELTNFGAGGIKNWVALTAKTAASFTAQSFDANKNPSNASFYYIAIGK